MIEQTYYPFGGETDSESLSHSASFSVDSPSNRAKSNLLIWVLLICTLLGIMFFLNNWKPKS